MGQIGLFFGSDTGNTELMAGKVQELLGGAEVVDVFNIHDTPIADMSKYKKIIIGISTWYDGELQSDWGNVFDDLDALDFGGKTVAIFGCGDQVGYEDYFLDAMGIVHEKIQSLGATMIGKWPSESYDFNASKAQVEEGFLCGVGFDFENQEELNDERVNGWCEQVKGEFGL